MKTSWMDLIERGPDADLGAALVRLAQQAATLHWLEANGGATGLAAQPEAADRLADSTAPQAEVKR